MARRALVGADLTQDRCLFAADILGDRAAGVEGAAGRRVNRARRIAEQDRTLAPPARSHRNGGEQRLGVGMARGREQRALPIVLPTKSTMPGSAITLANVQLEQAGYKAGDR